MMIIKYFLPLVTLLQLAHCQVLTPRGVPLTKRVLYDPNKTFRCLDGSDNLPPEHVNDDYCDCRDGSDEPGTSACSNGIFHCPNVGFQEKDIPSNRVNDKICDCCDGSDEYGPHAANCPNICLALGAKDREERRLYRLQLKEGSQIRLMLVEEAKGRKSQHQAELETLQCQLKEMEAIKAEKEGIKNAAESSEKEALDEIRAKQEELKKQREEQEEKEREAEERRVAEAAFHELDTDADGIVTFEDLKRLLVFDQDGDGVVADDEAKFFLHMKDNMDLEEFVTIGWAICKPYYNRLKEPTPESTEPQYSEPQEEVDVITGAPDPDSTIPDFIPHEDGIPHEDHIPETGPEEHEEFDEEEDSPPDFQPDHVDPNIPDPASYKEARHEEEEYDEATKALVDAAKKARDEYRDIEVRFSDVTRRVRDLETTLGNDYGPDDAFLSLHGQCFEMTDREYTYKLCPFDRASQRPKDGGAETSLGRWGRWTGSDNIYHRQKYEGGATCWNGPARSVDVSIKCGLTNEVVSASEPNRCEYAFEFRTPALCNLEAEHLAHDDDLLSHDEL